MSVSFFLPRNFPARSFRFKKIIVSIENLYLVFGVPKQSNGGQDGVPN